MIFLDHYVQPADGIVYKNDTVKLVLNRMEMGTGCLVLTDRDVTWDGSAKLQFGFLDLLTHSVSRDMDFYPDECVHAIVRSAAEVPEIPIEGEGNEAQSASGSQDVNHILLIPQDRREINAIDTALADLQALVLIEAGVESALDVELSEDEADEQEQEEDMNNGVGENGHGFENGEAEDMD